ncbi:head-tail adaptor protein [Azorhizobium sp. AG788]|uniref:head-tail adaptor protein n=1 Tax=Azorhizobium sp. AG788 TaxID=2183897 RepID=UPI0031394090
MSAPAIGALRHRIDHQTAVETPDGLGGVTRTFVTVDRLWGSIETAAATGTLGEERRFGLATVRVTVRAPNTIAAGDLLRAGARRLGVEATSDPDGRSRFTLVHCREEQS